MSGPIVAMGGAEFSMRPENEALHDFVLAQTRAGPSPRICLMPTASGDPRDQIISFHAAMERRGCVASALSLFRLGVAPIDLAEHLLSQDAIYVTGGSMVNLLALWREHRLDEIMRAAHEQGILLCGYSAGSMCWFEHGISRGGGSPAPFPGLGLLGGSHCVHYSQDPARRDAFRSAIGSGLIGSGLALDDHAAALIREGDLVEAVRSREASSAYRVEPDGAGGVSERRIPARLLAASMPSGAELGLEEMRQRRLARSRTRVAPGRRRGRI
ncbi:MAG: peptidase E [Solirubrobacterales bacterium]|nr:peptidase E [Solirubrobacterales bacterium]